MKKGEKAILTCGPDYAYGDSGTPPSIPGGATLNFEVLKGCCCTSGCTSSMALQPASLLMQGLKKPINADVTGTLACKPYQATDMMCPGGWPQTSASWKGVIDDFSLY